MEKLGVVLGASFVLLCFHVTFSCGDNPVEAMTAVALPDETLPLMGGGLQALLGHLADTLEPHNLRETASLVLSWRVGLAAALVGAGALVSAIGGIGGGALYVPILNLVLSFDTRMAAVLSNYMIFSGMLGTVSWYILQKNPYAPTRDLPLIDYDTVLLLQPNMLLGISIGVICNVMFPGWLITALLVTTLSIMTVRSALAGCHRWNHESSQRESRKNDHLDEEEEPLKTHITVSEEDGRENAEIHEPLLPSKHSSQFPPLKLSLLFLIWIAFFAVQFLRGEIGKKIFNVETCDTGYWLITSGQLPLTFIISASLLYISHRNPRATSTSLSSKAFRRLPLMALFAGVLGGTLGIGGGLIINPLLHDLGMPPQVTAATCAFTIFFSSSMSVVQFWLLGQSPLDYAAFFSLVSLFFSVIGLQCFQRAIIRSGRLSLIIFAVTIVMGTSATFMAFFGTIDAWRDFLEGKHMGLSPPC